MEVDGTTKSFAHDSAAWADNCHLETYGSVRLKSFFLNIAKTNYPGEMKLNLNKEKLY